MLNTFSGTVGGQLRQVSLLLRRPFSLPPLDPAARSAAPLAPYHQRPSECLSWCKDRKEIRKYTLSFVTVGIVTVDSRALHALHIIVCSTLLTHSK